MDPADSDTLGAAIRSQGVLLKQHEDQLTSIFRGLQEINACHQGLQLTLTSILSVLTQQLQRLLAHLGSPPPVLPPVSLHIESKIKITFESESKSGILFGFGIFK